MKTNVSARDLSCLLTLITAAALDARKWQGVTDRLTDLCGGCPTHLLGFDNSGTETGFVASGYDPAMLCSYEEYYAGRNAWAPGFITRGAGSVLNSQEMCPDAELVKTEFYQDWVRPQDDIALGGGGVIANGVDGTFVVGGNIPRRLGDEAVEHWLGLLELVVPHLQESWRIARRITAARLAKNGTTLAILILNAQGRIVFADRGATDILAAGTPLGVDMCGRLRPTDDILVPWLAQARASIHGIAERYLPPPVLAAGWEIAAAPVNPDTLDVSWPLALAGLHGPGLCITLSRTQPVSDRATALGNEFGLTTAEAEVAVSIGDGLAPKAIAEQRQVSVHTVRNQIKSAMLKCGVRRQSQMVALIARRSQE